MRRDVEFVAAGGVALRGTVHYAMQAPSPGIVMAHGFSGVREQIEHYAAYFAEAGYATLVYDHRGFGASGGTPRLEVDAAVQIADWRDAVTFALTQPEFDASAGVGLWGTSFAGGLAMVVAANDRRVRCVVSQIPHVSGHRNGREMFDASQRAELERLFAADRAARFAGAAPAMIPVFATAAGEPSALPPATTPKRLAAAMAQAPSWRNEVTLRSVENMNHFEAAGWARYIAPTPWLMIVGKNDSCTFPEIELAVYAEALEPKRLVVHPGGHFDTYTEHFELTSASALAWYREHLAPARGGPAGGAATATDQSIAARTPTAPATASSASVPKHDGPQPPPPPPPHDAISLKIR